MGQRVSRERREFCVISRMVRILLIFHPETQANIGDLQGSETATPLGHQSFPAPAQLISQHPTAFYLNLTPKWGWTPAAAGVHLCEDLGVWVRPHAG